MNTIFSRHDIYGINNRRNLKNMFIFAVAFASVGSYFIYKSFALTPYGEIPKGGDQLVARYDVPMSHELTQNDFSNGAPPAMLLYGDGTMLCSTPAEKHLGSHKLGSGTINQRRLTTEQIATFFEMVRNKGFDELLARDLPDTVFPPAGSTTSVSLITSSGERRVTIFPEEKLQKFDAITTFLKDECSRTTEEFAPDEYVMESIKLPVGTDKVSEPVPDIPHSGDQAVYELRTTTLSGEDAKKAKVRIGKTEKLYKTSDNNKLKVRVIPKLPEFQTSKLITKSPPNGATAHADTYRNVRFLYVYAADQAQPSDAQSIISDLAATLPSYYLSQTGKAFTTSGVSVVRGSKTVAQYQACPTGSSCIAGTKTYQSLGSYYNLSNEFRLANLNTILVYGWADDNVCIGWGGPLVSTDNVSVNDYGFATYSGNSCWTDAIHMLGAHEGGHGFGLVHTCEATMMDGCGYSRPAGYGSALNAGQAALLRNSSPYFNGPSSSLPAPVKSGSTFISVNPARLLETRPGLSTVDGSFNNMGVRPGGSVTELQVAGRAGIPSDALAAALNITIINPVANGFAVAFPCGINVPGTSNINFNAGVTISNSAISKLSGGKVCVYSNVATDMVIDINGAFPSISTGSYTNVTPSRMLETRPGGSTVDGQFNGIGRLAGGSVTQLQMTGRIGIPANASSVSMNITAINGAASGFITVFPCDIAIPNTSSVNYTTGQIVSNAIISKLGSGKVCIYTNNQVDLVIDVNGAFNEITSYKSVAPARIVESRAGLSTIDGQYSAIGIRSGGSVTEIQVAGRAGIPNDALAVSLNVAAITPSANGFMVVFPCGMPIPGSSNVNYMAGATIANSVIAKLGSGKICIYTNNTTDLIVDVTGAFMAADSKQYALSATLPEPPTPVISPELTTPSLSTVPKCVSVTLFTEANFVGPPTATYTKGRYNSPLFLGNDTISSIRIKTGCKVIMYQDASFSGASQVLYNDWAGAANDPWDNKLSSFEVVDADYITASTTIKCPSSGIKLYPNANFSGTYQLLKVGKYDSAQLTVGNDQVSSVKVSPGCKAILYQNSAFGGATKILTADWTGSTTDPWDNVTSSVWVKDRAVAVVDTVEMLNNRGFEDGLTSWGAYTPAGGTLNYLVKSSTTGQAHAGTKFLEMSTNPGSGSVYQDVAIAPVSGTTYQLSAWVKSPLCTPASGTLAIWGLWSTNENGAINFTADCTWRYVKTLFTAQNPANSVFRAQVYLNTPSTPINLDAFSLLKVTYKQ